MQRHGSPAKAGCGTPVEEVESEAAEPAGNQERVVKRSKSREWAPLLACERGATGANQSEHSKVEQAMQAWQGEASHALRIMQSKQSNAPHHAPQHHTTHHTPHHFTPRASVWQLQQAWPGEQCKAKRVEQCKGSRCNEQSKQVLHAARLQSTTLNLVSTRVRGVTLYS